MNTGYQPQDLASAEQLGAETGHELQWSGLQAQQQQQHHHQMTQGGEPKQQPMASISPIMQDAAGNRCQADGCMADLSGLRRYFRRYHVCETHIRSQVVLIQGREVRFCDQCSTFHPISLFDGPRRTCREKLEQNRLKRRIRKQQTGGGNLGGQQGAGAALAAAAGGAAGGGGGPQSDDADSDDQPPNGRTAADGDDLAPMSPTGRGVTTSRRGKRPSGVSAQGSRRQHPAPRQSAGPDVTRAVGAYRASASSLGRADSQSPDLEDEEMDRRAAGASGFREETAWGATDIAAAAGLALNGALGGGALDGRDAGYGAGQRAGLARPSDLGGAGQDWPRLQNHHDLRDQEHLQGAFAARDMGGYLPREPQQQHHQQQHHQQQQQRGPPGLQVQWGQSGRAPQSQPLLQLPHHEVETGGVIALQGLPPGAMQGPRRQHGGSMPNLPQEPPVSPPSWPNATERHATWHAVPAVPGISAGTPRGVLPQHDRALRDGAFGFAAPAPAGGAAHQLLQLQPVAPNGTGPAEMAGRALERLSGFETGRDGPVGPLMAHGTAGRAQGRVPGATLDSEAESAPAVTLLKHFPWTEPDCRRQQPSPRPSQATPETLSPVKAAPGGGADLLRGAAADALGPAEVALQLRMDAGLLGTAPNAFASVEQPQQQQQAPLGAGLHRPWAGVMQRDPQLEQELQGQLGAGNHGLVGQARYGGGIALSGGQDGAAWMADRAVPQTGVWGAAPASLLAGAPHGLRAGPVSGPRPFATALPPPSMDDRRLSAGSSIYTADEEGAGYEEPEVNTAALVARAKAAAEGRAVGSVPNLEGCPSLLQKASFQQDLQTAMLDAQRWEQQQRMSEQWNHHQQQQQQQRVQVLLSFRQAQAGNHDEQQRARPAVTLLDHHIQQQQQALASHPQQQREQRQQLMAQVAEQGQSHEHSLQQNSTDNISLSRLQPLSQQPSRQAQLVQQQSLTETFGRLYEARQRHTATSDSHIHLSAFHMQSPVHDLDLDADFLKAGGQWQPHPHSQHGHALGGAAATHAANLQVAGAGTGWHPHVNVHGAGGAPAPAPSPPPQQLEAWAGKSAAAAVAAAKSSGWRTSSGDGVPAPGFAAHPRQQQPSPPSAGNHVPPQYLLQLQQQQQQQQQHQQQHMNRCLIGGGGPSSLDPSDQELIRSTLMNLAAQAPPRMAAGAGQQRGGSKGMSLASLAPALDGRDCVVDAGGGGAYVLGHGHHTAPSEASWGGGRNPEMATEERHTSQPQQQPPARLDATHFGESGNQQQAAAGDGDQPMAQGGEPEVLRQMSSVAISEVLLDSGRSSLLDMELFAQVQLDLRNDADGNGGSGNGNGNNGPALVAVDAGEPGLHGGPPTPQPLGGEGGFVGAGHGGGGGRVIAEDEGPARPSSDRQALGGTWQPQQQRQERAVPQGTLQAQADYRQNNDQQQTYHHHHQQQQQPWGHQQQQQWSQQQWTQRQQQDAGTGSCGGGQTLSHLALKLSHARAEGLPAELVERMQEALRGGGAAVLPPTLREGCVEVLVEVLHSCPALELSSRLFSLPAAADAGSAGSSAAGSAAAAVAASDRLRAWVGPEVFDACERVTMQLLRGPVLDCRPGAPPELRQWEAAMQQAGLAFATHWPDMLTLQAGPPVLVADPCKPQQIHVYAPPELESRLGLVQLCVRMAGGPCSLGTVEAVAMTTSLPRGGAMPAVAAAADGEPRQGTRAAAAAPSAARALRIIVEPASGADVGEEDDAPLTLASGVAPSTVGNSSFAFRSARAESSETPGALAVQRPEQRDQQQQQQLERPSVGIEIGKGRENHAPQAGNAVPAAFGSARSEGKLGAGAAAAGPRCFPSLTARVAEAAGAGSGADKETTTPLGSGLRSWGGIPPAGASVVFSGGGGSAGPGEPLRSCFLMAAPFLSQPSSPTAAQQQQQQQQSASPSKKQQPLQPALLPRQHAVRGRSKSADGAALTWHGLHVGNQAHDTGSPGALAAAAVPSLKCKSLNRQTSSRRGAAYHAAAAAAALAALAGRGGLEALSQRLSICSSAALTTAMTLHERLSCRSSAAASTTATTLYDRLSLCSDWSVVSTLTSLGGALAGSAGGGCCAGGTPPRSGGGAATGISSSQAAEPLPPATTGTMSNCSDQMLGSAVCSGTTTATGSSSMTTWVMAASGGRSPEGRSPLGSTTNEAHRSRLSPRGPQPAARRALVAAWQQPQQQPSSLKVATAASATNTALSDPKRDPDCDPGTPRLALAPAGLRLSYASSAQPSGAGDLQAASPAAEGRVLAGLKTGLHPLRLALPVLPRAGLALLEATGGHAVAGSWPLLVVETATQRNELALLWWELGESGRQDAWRGVAADLGLVLGNLPRRARARDPDLLMSAAPRLDLDADGGAGKQHPAARLLRATAVTDAAAAAGGRPAAVAAETPVCGVAAAASSPSSRARPVTVAAAAVECGTLDASYTNSTFSGESACQESWGTIAPQSGSEQLAANSLPTAEPSPRPLFAGCSSISSEKAHDSGKGSSPSGGMRRVLERMLMSATAAVAAGGDGDGSSRHAGAPARAVDLPTSWADRGSEGGDGKGGEQPPTPGRVCTLLRGDEVSLASGAASLDGEAGGDGEDDPRVAAVTSFLAGMRVATGADSGDADRSRPTPPERRTDATDVSCRGNGGEMVAAATTASAPARTLSAADVHAKAATATEAQSPGLSQPQASGIAAAPSLPPAAAVGLSADARAALRAAVSRLRAIVDRRRLPALSELLSRLDAEAVSESESESQSAPAPEAAAAVVA